MKLYAPVYYQKFSCLAGECRHSCCIGWEIDVDKKTLKKYKRLKDKAILASIEKEGAPHFCLSDDERCPHLDERGLCRIIKTYGEGYLCDICREHPRFYHDTVNGREVGIGMSCEEACRLLLTEDFTVEEIGKTKGRAHSSRFNALPEREKIDTVLSEKKLSYPERLLKIADEYGIALKADTSVFASLEYLKEENRARFAASTPFTPISSTPKEIEEYLLRALAYFVYRHVTAAKSESEVRMAVGFSLLCERLLCSLAVKENALTRETFAEIARVVSEELEYSEDNTAKIKFLFFS